MSEKDIYNNKLEQIEKKVVRNTIANTHFLSSNPVASGFDQ